jgi:hypothetical protein
MKNSNKKLFIHLNDFSSGYNCLALNFVNAIDNFHKDDFLTEHRFSLSILISTKLEHQKISNYKLMDMSFVEKLIELIKKKDGRTSK